MTIHSYVKRQLYGQALLNSIIAVVFGIPALFHLWLMYHLGAWGGPAMLWFWESKPAFLAPASGIVFLAVLILSTLRADQAYWTTYTYHSKSKGVIPVSKGNFILHGVSPLRGPGLPADLQVFAPASINLCTKLISLPLLIGPMLLLGAGRKLMDAVSLLTVNTIRLAECLSCAFDKGGRISFDDVSAVVPGFKPEKDLPPLVSIDGVLVLHKEMQGIALSENLQEKVRMMRK